MRSRAIASTSTTRTTAITAFCLNGRTAVPCILAFYSLEHTHNHNPSHSPRTSQSRHRTLPSRAERTAASCPTSPPLPRTRSSPACTSAASAQCPAKAGTTPPPACALSSPAVAVKPLAVPDEAGISCAAIGQCKSSEMEGGESATGGHQSQLKRRVQIKRCQRNGR